MPKLHVRSWGPAVFIICAAFTLGPRLRRRPIWIPMSANSMKTASTSQGWQSPL